MSGLTSQGLEIKRLEEILSDFEASLAEQFGAELVSDPESGAGRLAGIFANPVALLHELIQDVHNSAYPGTADGVSLDNVIDLNGLKRLKSEFSSAFQLLIGDPGTLIASGSEISNLLTKDRFALQADVTLDADEVISASWRISGAPHGAGETYDITIDGVLTSVVTSGGESDAAIASALGVGIDPDFPITAIDQTARKITIAGDQRNRFGLIGKRCRIQGAVGMPNNNGEFTIAAAELVSGDTVVEVTEELLSPDVTGDLKWNTAAVGLGDQLLAISSPLPAGATDARDFAFGFSFSSSIPANFVNEILAVPVEVLALELGPIEAAVQSLTVIETPTTGWTSTQNILAAEPGRFIEQDSETRLRRSRSIRQSGTAMTEALRARLLTLPGVDDANVFENDTSLVVDGRPPHSVEAVVTGGRDDDIAETIFNTVCGGIATHGNAVQIVTDTQGFAHTIRYSRPTDIAIFVEVTVNSLYDEEALPLNASEGIKDAVVAFGSTSRAGLDVLPERFKGPIFAAVPGLASITVKVGIAAPPAVSETPLDIEDDEVARFDVARVTVLGL